MTTLCGCYLASVTKNGRWRKPFTTRRYHSLFDQSQISWSNFTLNTCPLQSFYFLSIVLSNESLRGTQRKNRRSLMLITGSGLSMIPSTVSECSKWSPMFNRRFTGTKSYSSYLQELSNNFSYDDLGDFFEKKYRSQTHRSLRWDTEVGGRSSTGKKRVCIVFLVYQAWKQSPRGIVYSRQSILLSLNWRN